jgi:hypothetical protein
MKAAQGAIETPLLNQATEGDIYHFPLGARTGEPHRLLDQSIINLDVCTCHQATSTKTYTPI